MDSPSEQIKALKAETETEIRALIKRFEKDSGCRVFNIGVRRLGFDKSGVVIEVSFHV